MCVEKNHRYYGDCPQTIDVRSVFHETFSTETCVLRLRKSNLGLG